MLNRFKPSRIKKRIIITKLIRINKLRIIIRDIRIESRARTIIRMRENTIMVAELFCSNWNIKNFYLLLYVFIIFH